MKKNRTKLLIIPILIAFGLFVSAGVVKLEHLNPNISYLLISIGIVILVTTILFLVKTIKK